MHTFVFETTVPAQRRSYCALAFTPRFDEFIMREFGLGTIEEHGAESARARALDAEVSSTFCAPDWHDWRRQLPVAGLAEAHLPVAPYVRASDLASGAVAPRKFRLRPASRVVTLLKSALYYLGYGEDATHYDAVQVRLTEDATGTVVVRFFLRAEAASGFAVEGVTTFHDVEGAPGHTLQRVHLAITTGSWWLDRVTSLFVESALRPEFSRMADAVERWRAAGNEM